MRTKLDTRTYKPPSCSLHSGKCSHYVLSICKSLNRQEHAEIELFNGGRLGSVTARLHFVQRRCTQIGNRCLEADDPMPATIYGIKNCDTMKKARAFLDERGVTYAFHDYKVAGIEKGKLERWAKKVGWETLLNKA